MNIIKGKLKITVVIRVLLSYALADSPREEFENGAFFYG